MEYDGLKPFAFRIGARSAARRFGGCHAVIRSNVFGADLADHLARTMAGADGRDAASLLYIGDRIFGAFSLTGGKVGDTPVYQEQDALLGRVAGLLYSTPDTNIVLSAMGTDIAKLPDSTPGPNPDGHQSRRSARTDGRQQWNEAS